MINNYAITNITVMSFTIIYHEDKPTMVNTIGFMDALTGHMAKSSSLEKIRNEKSISKLVP